MKNELCGVCGSGPAVREQVVTQACGDTPNSIEGSHMWSTFTSPWADTVGGDSAQAIKEIN